MKDAEVGDVWRDVQHEVAELGELSVEQALRVLKVILKLIEERAYMHYLHSGDEEDSRETACSEFSIPYDEYLKAKEAK